MKYKYEFATESVEIECDDRWGLVLKELDRWDYNNDHKETRRHCSLDALNLDGAYIPSQENVEATVLATIEIETLQRALCSLNERQRYLVIEYFFHGRTQVDLAMETGVDKSAVRHAISRATEKIKKYLI